VLVDTHWIGGDPGQGQVYGWAAWSPAKSVLALRNPNDKVATFAADAQAVFQLPTGAAKPIRLVRWILNGKATSAVQLQPGQTHVFTLQPFEVAVWEAEPETNLSQGAATAGPLSN